MVTHLPIFGVLMGLLVLVQGIWKKNSGTIVAAYTVLIISTLGACTAFLTGEGAEEAVEHIAGVTESAIHEHEEAADFALWSMIIMGLTAIVAMVMTLRKHSKARLLSFITLFIALFAWSTVARTGWLGGQIRHTEVAGAQGAAGGDGGGGEVEDDD
jgi:hypothetical protein